MITLENRFFPVRMAACFVIEGGIILLSVVTSYYLLGGNAGSGAITLGDVFRRGVLIALCCQTCMYMLDLYDLRHSQSWKEIFFALLFSVGAVCIGIGLVTLALPEYGMAGNLYYLTILLIATLLLFWRIGFDFYLARLAPRERILLLGSGEDARVLAAEIRARSRLGFHLEGYVGARVGDGSGGEVLGEHLGEYGQLKDVVREKAIRKVVVAVEQRRGEYPLREMLDARVAGYEVVEWPVYYERLCGCIPIGKLPPSFFIFNEGFRKSPTVLFLRRCLSLLAAVVLLVLLLPLIALAAVAIRLDTAGPVFYSQERVGQGGRPFRIWKFRSMRTDAEAQGARWASEGDPRVTRVGRIIRKTRIDEIPQLFNVLKGDIDLVGPRPERPEFVRNLQEMIPYYFLRHTVKPGLTGWAQVMFPYCGSIEESREKLQYDLFYIKNMSVKLDLLILFRTVKIVLLGRGAR